MDRRTWHAWTRHREKMLYVLVGGWNTLVQYAIFALCWYLFHDDLSAEVILVVSYLIGSVNGFLCFRYIVFRPARHPFLEYLRFQVIYVPLLLLNMLVLPLLLRHTSLNAYAIQGLWVVFVVVAGYLGNKYFTFRGGIGRSRDSARS